MMRNPLAPKPSGIRQLTKIPTPADLDSGETLNRAVEDRMLQGDSGIERVADGFDSQPLPLKRLACSGVLFG
jgi:hypothetical protein